MGYAPDYLVRRRRASERARRRRRRLIAAVPAALVIAAAAVVVLTGHPPSEKTALATPRSSPPPVVAAARGHEEAAATRTEFADVRRLARYGLPLFCGGRARRVVALTFDDGPGPDTTLASGSCVNSTPARRSSWSGSRSRPIHAWPPASGRSPRSAITR